MTTWIYLGKPPTKIVEWIEKHNNNNNNNNNNITIHYNDGTTESINTSITDISNYDIKKLNIVGISFNTSNGITSNATNNEQSMFKDCDLLSCIDFSKLTTISHVPNNYCCLCENLATADLHNISAIGEWAFNSCYNLRHIDLGDNLQKIGTAAFCGCSNIQNIKIGHVNYRIFNEEDSIFNYNNKIMDDVGTAHLEITSDIIYLPENSFSDFTAISSVSLPNSLYKIEYSAFYNCANLLSIKIPDSVKIIKDYVFSECSSLSSIEFPNNSGGTLLGTGAFMNCTSLSTLEFPATIVCNEQFTFVNSNNMSKTFKSTSLFLGCSNLKNITFYGTAAEAFPIIYDSDECNSELTVSFPNLTIEQIANENNRYFSVYEWAFSFDITQPDYGKYIEDGVSNMRCQFEYIPFIKDKTNTLYKLSYDENTSKTTYTAI